jgi:hypothetical protein
MVSSLNLLLLFNNNGSPLSLSLSFLIYLLCSDTARPTYRCCRCYEMLQQSIAEKARVLGRTGAGTTIPAIPALATFLPAPWGELARTKSQGLCDSLLDSVDGLSTICDPGLPLNFCVVWDFECPSCFNCDFEDPAAALPECYSTMKPSFSRKSIILENCPVLDDETGTETKKTIHLDVISCSPLISFAESTKFKFRAADEKEHVNYETFFPPPPPMDNKTEHWQLVRAPGLDSQAMSLIRVGCLDPFFKKKTISETKEASQEVLSLLREGAGYRKQNSGKAPATLVKALAKVGLFESSIRVNRVGGPMGHAGGMSMSGIRRGVLSPFVSNCVPRNRPLGNIVVPFQVGSMVAFMAPFHIGVRQKETLAVASPPHNSIPRHGFVTPGAKVYKAFQDSEHLGLLRTFTATVYSGARILHELAKVEPALTTSENAVRTTLANEARRRVIFSQKLAGPSSHTRSRQDDGRNYSVGQSVHVFASTDIAGKYVCL